MNKHKVVGYTALWYGKDYLSEAIRSIINHVDEYHILYATHPSHGHQTLATNPETAQELHEMAWQAAGTKLKWHRGDWFQEGEQRSAIYGYAPDAAVIVSVDSDEIYSEKLIESIMHYAFSVTNSVSPYRYLRVPFIHYWRSFHRCVMHDPAFPARVIFPQIRTGEFSWSPAQGVVNHMGYATRPEIVKYKWEIHGHKNELRKDVNWFEDVFMANRQTDCHPVGSEFWNPEPVNPMDYMPAYMRQHPFYEMKVIE